MHRWSQGIILKAVFLSRVLRGAAFYIEGGYHAEGDEGEFATYGETEQNLECDITEGDIKYDYPSAIRRFVFFCVWAVIALIALGIVAE